MIPDYLFTLLGPVGLSVALTTVLTVGIALAADHLRQAAHA